MNEEEKEAVFYLINNFEIYEDVISFSNYNTRTNRELIEKLKIIKNKLEREWFNE